MLLSPTDSEGVCVTQGLHGDPQGNTSSCHPEATMAHSTKLGWFHETFPFVFLGWTRAIRRLQLVHEAILRLQHLRHANAVAPPGCPVCDGTLSAAVERKATRSLVVVASLEVGARTSLSKLGQIATLHDGVWITSRRLGKEGPTEWVDLDFSPFFDSASIQRLLPVVDVTSPIFHSLLLDIHYRELPHAGVESTLARIMQTFYPIGYARRAIAKVRNHCSACRILLRKVIGAELAQLHRFRYTIAPPFYALMADIAMGFKGKPFKESRKSFPVSALVMVCLLTSATFIHVLDSLETQSVVMALERHSSRYGVPGHVFVDAGTQLEKLKDTAHALRDLQGRISPGRKFTVTVATPKAHEQQGRVEAKIKTIRGMLIRLAETSDEVNTLLGWETTFARIADHIDDLPISRGTASAPDDLGWEIITPNRLKIGRNNFKQLHGGIRLYGAPQSLLERNRLLQERWYQLFVERIHLLIPPPTTGSHRVLVTGDVVLFVFTDAGSPKMWEWKLGVITRQVSRTTYEIRYANTTGGRPRFLERNARDITLVCSPDEISPMSDKFPNAHD